MAPGILFGLFVIGLGLLFFVIAQPLARGAAIMRTWFSATADIAWWTQRGTGRVRLLAAGFILLGIVLLIYGLISGQ